MSVLLELVCDAPDCYGTPGMHLVRNKTDRDGLYPAVDAMEVAARRHGWRTLNGGWLCPDCAHRWFRRNTIRIPRTQAKGPAPQ